MHGLTAVAFARNRVMLLGEAAHVLPPIGAQGLNLSLRDAATAAELITDAAKFGDDPGGPRPA
jgi:2-octaprenyl-6-methoxyphenol hydroxylase